ncbi:hypothetical protein [Candidatus Amarolinea dominans]
MLKPMATGEQSTWEVANYALALLAPGRYRRGVDLRRRNENR